VPSAWGIARCWCAGAPAGAVPAGFPCGACFRLQLPSSNGRPAWQRDGAGLVRALVVQSYQMIARCSAAGVGMTVWGPH
jgi:hypothetical protein